MKTSRMSLNPIPSIIQYVDLVDEFKKERKLIRQLFGFNLSFADWKKYKRVDVDKRVKKPINMLNYYQRVKASATGKYMNFK